LHRDAAAVLIGRVMPVPNSATPSSMSSAHRQRRILVADDNRDAGETLAILLRLDGHEVHVATDGLEAVELFGRVKPDVAILDIGMPGLSGHEVARRIRNLGGESPVTLIALTGWGQRADKERAAESGFDHHFTKPVEPTVLSRLLDEDRPPATGPA
jgi:CheY-like chemotaxis protein